MNIKRSYFKLLFASVTVGLFLANCTVKESSSGDSCTKGDTNSCDCPGNAIGHQVCSSQGVYGSCICPGVEDTGGTSSGGTTSTGGTETTTAGTKAATGGTTTSYAGANDGGTPPVSAAEGGAGGAGASFDPEDCEACLQKLCPTEFEACLADDQCISTNTDGSGQYERIAACINNERVNGLVKRDVVRGCGVTIGVSPDPDLASEWAPEGMSANTTNLLNCLATSASKTPNADWANSDANFPVVKDMVVPAPWPTDSCAALACTSKFQ